MSFINKLLTDLLTTQMNIEKSIVAKLEEALQPEEMRLKNNSSLHSGHLGDDGSGQTHFALEIKSAKLHKKSRIEAHRIITQLLQEEFKNGLHALEIKVLY